MHLWLVAVEDHECLWVVVLLMLGLQVSLSSLLLGAKSRLLSGVKGLVEITINSFVGLSVNLCPLDNAFVSISALLNFDFTAENSSFGHVVTSVVFT